MAKLYKKVLLLVSRRYDPARLDEGFEKGPLMFLRSIDEYEELRKHPDWMCARPGGFWVTEPKEIEVHVDAKAHSLFLAGKPLPVDRVLFAADKVDEVRKLG